MRIGIHLKISGIRFRDIYFFEIGFLDWGAQSYCLALLDANKGFFVKFFTFVVQVDPVESRPNDAQHDCNDKA